MKMAARMALIAAVMLTTTSVASAADLSENFNSVVPSGWSVVNNSSSVGSTSWFQGTSVAGGGPFDAYDGAVSAYAAANYNATGSTGTINLWLITPSLSTLTNGDAWSFYTRKVAPDTYADRLEVRVSTGGGCNPGSGPTSVGDFTTLVTTINPSLVLGVYPTAWTQLSGVLSALPAGASTGCLAFRYFVTNAGSSGTNGDYVGVDAFRFTEDVIAPDPVSVTAVSPAGPSSNDTPSVTGSGAEAGSTVNIYDNDACTGTSLGSGTADDFVGSGVTATVPHDTTTTLYATATDGSGNESACSTTSVSYTNDSTPPAAPTVTAVSPVGPSSDDTPSVTGSGAEAGSTVDIYDNAACTGTALGSGTADDFNGSTGVTATVPHDTTTTLYATATDPSGNESDCSATNVDYTNDSTPPAAPTLTATSPASPSSNDTPSVTGSGAEAGSTVDIYDNAACTGTSLGSGTADDFNGSTGVTATVAHDTTTTLYATATDGSGNESTCSTTSVSYTNDSTPPAAPTVTATSPASPSSNDTPSVTGSGAEADSTVNIYDNAACTGTALGSGTADNFNGSTGVTATIPHDTTTTLYATATDASGNRSACSTTKVSYTNRPTPPKADSPTPPPAPKLTSFATGWRTHDTAPKLSGRAGDGTNTVTLLVYAGQTPTGTPVETQQLPVVNGVWSTKPLTGLAPGPYVAVIHAGAAGAVAISQPVAFEILGPCQSRRLLTLHLHAPKGGYRAIAVTLGGKKLAVRGGKRAPAVHVDLRGRGKGTYTVRIAGTTASGRHVRATRTFRTCGRAVR
jgi:hypothetical protein